MGLWLSGVEHGDPSQELTSRQWHGADPGGPRTMLIRERILRGQRETCLARIF